MCMHSHVSLYIGITVSGAHQSHLSVLYIAISKYLLFSKFINLNPHCQHFKVYMFVDGMLSDLGWVVKVMVSIAMVVAGRDKIGLHFTARSRCVLYYRNAE